MADGKIKISELSEALQINNDAVFPYSQDNGGTDATFGAPMTQIARKVTEGVDFTNLETSNKKIVGAINQTLNNFAEEYDTTETYNTGDPALHDGTLYKCKADNVTGTWDSTKWEEAKAVDFGSGGGGGGGHTILDDSGTALTQRTKMQFVGANSVDDSTNGKTVVRVLRSMTKAEFDLLTDAEKQGIINVTDVTGNSENEFQPVIYSEDEREIGVWIDGKPLYQKTIVLQNVTVPTGSGYTYDITSLNVDAPIETPQGFIVLSSGTDKRALPFNLLGNYGMTIAVSRTSVVLSRASADITCDYVIFTIRYTKTTDTAGSGQWTPQGVPAVHYSETEQVVGTWIDGSTIYEKSFDLSSQLTVSYSSWTSTGITASYISRILGVEFMGVNNYQGSGLANLQSDVIQLQATRNDAAYVKTFVLRYTKSST
jgi:hypothetical protein